MCYSFKNINNIQNHIMKDSKPICNELTTFEIYLNKISTYLKAMADELGSFAFGPHFDSSYQCWIKTGKVTMTRR